MSWRLLSPNHKLPADGLAQQVQGSIRTGHTTVVGPPTFISVFKLTNPKLGKRKLQRLKNKQTNKHSLKETTVSLLCREPFSLSAYCMPVLPTPLKPFLQLLTLSVPACSVSTISITLWCLRLSLPFSSLIGRENEPIRQDP